MANMKELATVLEERGVEKCLVGAYLRGELEFNELPFLARLSIVEVESGMVLPERDPNPDHERP